MGIGKRSIFVAAAALVLASAANWTMAPPRAAYAYSAGSMIAKVSTDKARYNPGTAVTLSVNLKNTTGSTITNGTVTLYFKHLENELSGTSQTKTYTLANNASTTLTYVWTPPSTDYQGYAVEAWARDGAGTTIDNMNSAVDVSSTWTKFPRYGFLSSFPSQAGSTSSAIVGMLKDYHINALQFYDWQYKHHLPVKGSVSNPDASWPDIAGRTTYKQTILDYIGASHNANISAMNYNLINGAFDGYGQDGTGVNAQWGLFDDSAHANQASLSMPGGWATSKLWYFNPANTNWQNYIFAKEQDAFNAFGFDGWHVDQIGNPGTKYDYNGNPVSFADTFKPFLDHAKTALGKTIVFNNVDEYGRIPTAQSQTDIMYDELWGTRKLSDVKTVLDYQTGDSGGKATVFPLYMNYSYQNNFTDANPGYFNTPGILLADAGFFAMGAQHLELGDDLKMLDHEYFPNHHLIMTDDLKKRLLGYYDFAVAYENLLRGGLSNTSNAVSLNGIASSTSSDANRVWTFTKSGGGYDVIHMVNQLGIADTDIRDTNANKPAPTVQTNVAVKYYYGSGTIGSVNFASPDYENGKTYSLAYTLGSDAGGSYVQFTVPTLQYWDMVYVKKTSSSTNIPVANPGFESGTITGWNEWHPTGQSAQYGVDATDAHGGGYKLYFWSTAAYQQSVHQVVSGLTNGSYTLTGWVKATAYGGSPTFCRMEAANFGGSTVYANMTVDGVWRQYSSTVNVTNGQLDIGFYINSPGSTSMQIDDIALTKN
ncbi:glycoside hydrolase family 66 protein [Paenibacillus sacheonensis]|uniref:Carbohydrate-binding protein n=1 Tax=Paenibacillus sacheonensis TaxID=742054 RepID=A0A7X4YTZ9_9BACL|nr:glycoside hydrolase family 66 protein [Paenibacillus sacheonensis]MBM7568629.1 dextranase [Paenibacillus sacheonensis]NBC72478.1 carbohydrate-binding protein [Paenibacillus sacheonensis]